MSEFKKIRDHINFELSELNKIFEKSNSDGDLSDIGNAIGMAIQTSIQLNKDKIGFDMESFMNGLKHGISIIDGTHSST